MIKGPYHRAEPMLTLAEAAEALGQPEAGVLADAANGSLRWSVIGETTFYPESTVRVLAARRNQPAFDPLVSRMEAGRLLGITGSAVSKLAEGGKLAREKPSLGGASYRLSVVLAYRDKRDGVAS